METERGLRMRTQAALTVTDASPRGNLVAAHKFGRLHFALMEVSQASRASSTSVAKPKRFVSTPLRAPIRPRHQAALQALQMVTT